MASAGNFRSEYLEKEKFTVMLTGYRGLSFSFSLSFCIMRIRDESIAADPSSVSPYRSKETDLWKSKKVALIGAGAIGSYLIWGLSRLADLSFTVIADGQRGERLREKDLSSMGSLSAPWYKERKKRAL